MDEAVDSGGPGLLRRTFENAAWLTGARFLAEFANFGFFVALSRQFGPAGIGQYAYAGAVAGVVYSLVNLGLEEYGIRESARRDRTARRRLLGGLLGLQLGITILSGLGVAGFLAATTPAPDVTMIIVLMSLYMGFLALSRTLFVPAFADEAMAAPALIELACRLGAIGASLLLVLGFESSLAAALVPFPVAAIGLFLLAGHSAFRHNEGFGIRLGGGDALEAIRATWPFAAAMILMHVNARADLVLLTWMRGDSDAGLYVSSLKFVEVAGLSLFFLGVAIYPTLSQLYRRDRERFLAASDVFNRTALTLGGLLAWGFFYVLPPVLVFVLGDEFAEAARILALLAPLALVMAADAIAIRMLLAADLQHDRLRMMTWGTLVKIALDVALIPWIGIEGAVLAAIGGGVVLQALYFVTLRRKLDLARLPARLAAFGGILVLAWATGEGVRWLDAGRFAPEAAALAVFSIAVIATGFLPLGRLRELLVR